MCNPVRSKLERDNKEPLKALNKASNEISIPVEKEFYPEYARGTRGRKDWRKGK